MRIHSRALETISLVIPKYFITLTGKSLPSWNTLRKMKTAYHLLSPIVPNTKAPFTTVETGES
jgi:hypothetical protein